MGRCRGAWYTPINPARPKQSRRKQSRPKQSRPKQSRSRVWRMELPQGR
jgi:hypothetical protein